MPTTVTSLAEHVQGVADRDTALGEGVVDDRLAGLGGQLARAQVEETLGQRVAQVDLGRHALDPAVAQRHLGIALGDRDDLAITQHLGEVGQRRRSPPPPVVP